MSYILTVFININSVLSVQDIRKLKTGTLRPTGSQITDHGLINIHEACSKLQPYVLLELAFDVCVKMGTTYPV